VGRSPARAGDPIGIYVGRREAATPPAHGTLPRATHMPAAVVEVAEHVLRHHSRQFLCVMEVGEHRIHVGLGCLQDLLQEGLLVVPGSQDCL
jgi:hypothetical protein